MLTARIPAIHKDSAGELFPSYRGGVRQDSRSVARWTEGVLGVPGDSLGFKVYEMTGRAPPTIERPPGAAREARRVVSVA